MHKKSYNAIMKTFFVLVIVSQINAQFIQRGPPSSSLSSGYLQYSGGRGPQISSHSLYASPSSYQYTSSKPAQYGIKPSAGPSKIIGWLGSQMAKLNGLGSRVRSPYSPKYKPIQTPGQSVVFSSPASHSSPYYGGGASLNSIHGSDLSHIYASSAPSYSTPPVQRPGPGMTPQNTVFEIISPDGKSRFQKSPPPGYENFFGQQGVIKQALGGSHQSSLPTPDYYHNKHQHQHQLGSQSLAAYYRPQYQQQAHHAKPLYPQASGSNMEVIPSKMVSYQQETLSTGHPDYQTALDGMSTAASGNYPLYARPTYAPNLQQQVQDVFNGVPSQVAPIFDVSSMQQQQSSASNQHSAYAQPSETSQNSMDAFVNTNQDLQADYSHAYQSVVPPPQDNMQTAESQVKILNHGASGDGNPTFEVIADANAPTYAGGHPFDINQLISMIEPGAQVDPKDIVAEGQEENYNGAPQSDSTTQ